MIDYLDWGFWCSDSLCASSLYSFEILICWLYWSVILHCLAKWPWFLPRLFCSLHMYRFIVVYLLTWCIDSLTCILYWSSLSMLSLSLSVLIVITCVDLSDIFVLCLIVCYMTTLFCVIACRLSVWATHLSSYFQSFGFGHFFHSDSHFCKCEALCVLAPLTELEVRSRV